MVLLQGQRILEPILDPETIVLTSISNIQVVLSKEVLITLPMVIVVVLFKEGMVTIHQVEQGLTQLILAQDQVLIGGINAFITFLKRPFGRFFTYHLYVKT